MTKYVKTEALLSAFVEAGQISKRYKLGDFWELNGAEIREVMDSMPAADVVEVRHGYWKYVKKKLARGGYVDASECSVCHKIIMPHLNPNYCPNCGAKMDLGG